jgi:signal peptidase
MKILLSIGYYMVLGFVIVLALILFAPVLPIGGNIDTKVVLSGSMEPEIPVGSVVVIKPAQEYFTDDVITFGSDSDGNIPTTHRIIEKRLESGIAYFKTKGDANPKPDTREVRETAVLGKVVATIPFLGYVIDFAKKPLGFFLLIIIPGAIVVLDELRKIFVEVRQMRRRKIDTKKPDVTNGEQ